MTSLKTLYLGAAAGSKRLYVNNTGDDVPEILDCGLRDKNDLVHYPDEGMLLVKKEGKVFRLGEAVDGWSSDPNPPPDQAATDEHREIVGT